MNTLGTDPDRPSRTAAEWLWPLLPIGASMFCLSALLYFHLRHDAVEVRSALQMLIAGLYTTFGFAPSFLFFLLVLTWSSIWFVSGRIERPWGRLGRLAAMTVMLGVFMNLGEGGVTAAFHKGELGAWFAERLVSAFGYYPSIVLVWAVTFASLLLATDFFFSDSFEKLRALAAPAEGGVEAAVTDHLKGLGGGQPAARGPADATPFAATGLPRRFGAEPEPVVEAVAPTARETTAESAAEPGEVEVEPVVEQPFEEPPRPRRRSYFERRREAAAEWEAQHEASGASATGRSPEDWVPTAPDSQEIDNPETAAESARAAESLARDQVAEADAPAPAAVEAEPGDDVVIVNDEQVEGDFAAPPSAVVAEGGPEQDTLVDEPAAARAADSEPDVDLDAEPEAAAEEQAPAAPAEDAAPRAEERVVPIPRPAPADAAAPARQQSLFGSAEEILVEEAIEIVTSSRRASATLLQRKLRIDYTQACRLLAELAARGVVELEADASHGRVVG